MSLPSIPEIRLLSEPTVKTLIPGITEIAISALLGKAGIVRFQAIGDQHAGTGEGTLVLEDTEVDFVWRPRKKADPQAS